MPRYVVVVTPYDASAIGLLDAANIEEAKDYVRDAVETIILRGNRPAGDCVIQLLDINELMEHEIGAGELIVFGDDQ
jgi:hypothetical protein